MTEQPEISDRLKQKVMSYYEHYKDTICQQLSTRETTCSYIVVPVLIDGVIDKFRYNVKERRIDQITVTIAVDGITRYSWVKPGLFGEDTVYAEKIKFIDIPIPEDD